MTSLRRYGEEGVGGDPSSRLAAYSGCGSFKKAGSLRRRPVRSQAERWADGVEDATAPTDALQQEQRKPETDEEKEWAASAAWCCQSCWQVAGPSVWDGVVGGWGLVEQVVEGGRRPSTGREVSGGGMGSVQASGW